MSYILFFPAFTAPFPFFACFHTRSSRHYPLVLFCSFNTSFHRFSLTPFLVVVTRSLRLTSLLRHVSTRSRMCYMNLSNLNLSDISPSSFRLLLETLSKGDTCGCKRKRTQRHVKLSNIKPADGSRDEYLSPPHPTVLEGTLTLDLHELLSPFRFYPSPPFFTSSSHSSHFTFTFPLPCSHSHCPVCRSRAGPRLPCKNNLTLHTPPTSPHISVRSHFFLTLCSRHFFPIPHRTDSSHVFPARHLGLRTFFRGSFPPRHRGSYQH
jgi:hypothetical protein